MVPNRLSGLLPCSVCPPISPSAPAYLNLDSVVTAGSSKQLYSSLCLKQYGIRLKCKQYTARPLHLKSEFHEEINK